MNTVTFDTHKIIEKLQARGFTKDQAVGFVEVLQESELVTQVALDIQTQKLITEMHVQRVAMMKWITGMLLGQAAIIVALLQLVG